jgi:hypothetical protein
VLHSSNVAALVAKRWALRRWERASALTVEPIEVECWLKALRKKHGLEKLDASRGPESHELGL